MPGIKKEVVAIFLLVILAIWVVYPLLVKESFNADGTEFVQVGEDRYGLRGDLLRRKSIRTQFIRPDQRVMLSESGGEMWVSNTDPSQQGMKNCRKVQCPAYGYDNLDECWQCAGEPVKTVIPDIWPHRH